MPWVIISISRAPALALSFTITPARSTSFGLLFCLLLESSNFHLAINCSAVPAPMNHTYMLKINVYLFVCYTSYSTYLLSVYTVVLHTVYVVDKALSFCLLSVLLYLYGGTAAAAPPPFRPSEPALCGSCPLVTPYYCRLGDLLCLFCVVSFLSRLLSLHICFFVLFVV